LLKITCRADLLVPRLVEKRFSKQNSTLSIQCFSQLSRERIATSSTVDVHNFSKSSTTTDLRCGACPLKFLVLGIRITEMGESVANENCQWSGETHIRVGESGLGRLIRRRGGGRGSDVRTCVTKDNSVSSAPNQQWGHMISAEREQLWSFPLVNKQASFGYQKSAQRPRTP
jgi:hypothetical protein